MSIVEKINELLVAFDRLNSEDKLNKGMYKSYTDTLSELKYYGEPLGADRIKDESFLDQQISDFDESFIPGKLVNFFLVNNKSSVRDLLNMTRTSCLQLPNAGNGMWKKIYSLQKALYRNAGCAINESIQSSNQDNNILSEKLPQAELFDLCKQVIDYEVKQQYDKCNPIFDALKRRHQQISEAFEKKEPYSFPLLDIQMPVYVRNITKALGVTTVARIFDISRKDVLALSGIGEKKWHDLVMFKNSILNNPDSIQKVVVHNSVLTILPVLKVEEMSLPIHEKIMKGIEQILQRMKHDGGRSERDASIFERRVINNESLKVIAEDLSLQEERVRQISVQLKKFIMYDEPIPGYPNVFFDRNLAKKLIDIATECLYRPLNVFVNKLQLQDSDKKYLQTFIDLCNLIVFVKTRSRKYQDQEYLIPKNETDFMEQHVKAIYDILCKKPFPVTKDDLYKDITGHEDVDHEWDLNVLDSIYNYHKWIARDDINDTCMMDYQHLFKAETKIARILYVNQPNELSKKSCKIYEQQHFPNENTNFKNVDVSSYREIVRGQRYDTYTYTSTNVQLMPTLRSAVHTYAKRNVKFSCQRMVCDLQRQGYIGFSDKTYRSYALNICLPAVDDADILCLESKTGKYPETNWRSRSIYGTTNWYINCCVSILKDVATKMKLSELNRQVSSLPDAANYNRRYFSRIDIEKYCCYEDDDNLDELFILDNRDRIRLNNFVLDNNLIDLKKIGLIDKTPIYYDIVSKEIIKQLKSAEGNKMRLAELLDSFRNLIQGTNQASIFYKIVAKLPENIEKINENDSTYLRLTNQ